MKLQASFAVLLIGVCCAVFGVCSCGKHSGDKKTVDPETLRLMQKTQAELVTCVERCKSAAEDSRNKEIFLALANSQQILVDRHETIINILLKKYKLDKSPTGSYPNEMDPRTLVLDPVPEYAAFLDEADPERILREVLIALEVTNKVLDSDRRFLSLVNPNSWERVPDLDLFLCPVCGLLTTKEPDEGCPVCHSDKDRIIKLKNGEIPPQDKESFIGVSE